MKSKFFYQQFKDEIAKEHKNYDTHQEEKRIPYGKCNHIGKVKIIDGELRCSCGAGWRGPEIDTLFDRFMKGDV